MHKYRLYYHTRASYRARMIIKQLMVLFDRCCFLQKLARITEVFPMTAYYKLSVFTWEFDNINNGF